MTMQATSLQTAQTDHRQITIAVCPTVKRNACRNETMSWQAFCERLKEFKTLQLTAEQLTGLNREQQLFYKDAQGAYVLGAVDDTGIRSNASMQTREGLTLDLDQQDSGSIAEIISRLEDSGLNFLAHSTAQHTDEKPRIRIILPFDRPLEKQHLHEYEGIAKAVTSRFLIPESDDHSSFEYGKAMFWPAHCKDIEPLFEYEAEGDYLPLDNLIQHVRKQTTEQPNLQDYGIRRVHETPTLRDDFVLDAVTLYEQKQREELQVYDPNYLSCQQTIAKAIMTGEITEEAGFDAVRILAGQNESWAADNAVKLKHELQNCRRRNQLPTTKYTFDTKFTQYIRRQREDQQRLEYWGHQAEQQDHALNWDTVINEPAKPRLFDRAGDLQNIELPPINFVVDEFLPQGVGWCAGSPKAGKSFLMIQLAHCVSKGDPFLGQPTTESVVLYYSLEMGRNLVQQRLKIMYGSEQRSNNLIIAYELPNFENGALNVLQQDIQSTGAKLVIIDTYAFISKSKSSQKPLYEETYKEIKELKDLADQLDITIVLVSHLNKQSLQSDPFDRIMGSVANRGASDFNMILANDPETKGQKIFEQESRKSKGFELTLQMTSRATFENLGSVDELRLLKEREEYLADPIANAIKKLLLSQASAELKASDFYENHLPDHAKYEIDTVNKLGNRINRLAYRLNKFDRIRFSKAKRRDGIFYIFERPKSQISLTPIIETDPEAQNEEVTISKSSQSEPLQYEISADL